MDQKLLGSLDRGLLFIVSAPAGTGKTTLVNMLTEEFSCVIRSISYTTRKPRVGEIDGKDYFFISKEEFKKKIEKEDFLEYAFVFNEYYGTSRTFVEQKINENKHVMLVIDTQGAASLRKQGLGIHIFVLPPDSDILKKRLKNRTDDSENMDLRLQRSAVEMMQVNLYDYKIVNDQLDIAYQILRSILVAEEHRINIKR